MKTSNIYFAKLKDFNVLDETIVRVNPLDGCFTHPSISPDGTKLAYWGIYQNNWDIWIADLVKGTVKNITQGKGTSCHPAWSADSDSIVYAHSSGKARSDNPYDNPNIETGSAMNLWRTGVADGTKKQLTFNETDSERPAFSPDGNFVAYVLSNNGYKNLCILDLLTLRSQQITHGDNIYYKPSWHPYKDILAFNSKGNENHYIYTVKTDGNSLKQITPTSKQLIHDHGAFWLPEDERILYHTDRYGSWKLCLINIKTGKNKTINFSAFKNTSHGSIDAQQLCLAFDSPQ